jgi:hypothetical protein
VRQHLHSAGKSFAGPSAPPDENTAFAATQAAWRFLHNDRVTLPKLAEPLLEVARQWRHENPTAWALVVHDWSALSYPTHRRKADRKSHGARGSGGYDLGTLLLVDGRQGDPVVPVEMELRTADRIYTTRSTPPDADESRLANIWPGMRALDRYSLTERVIHVIDREADSLVCYREWQADRRCFLVRADEGRVARWQGTTWSLRDLQQCLHDDGQFRRSRDVTYRGQAAVQFVAEASVVLDRPAWRQRRRAGRAVNDLVKGPPLALRLVVSRVCNACGETLAVWHLLTNAPAEVDAATVALWYYWRWRIESFFELLKSGGQAAEQWQQETGAAIARRLLVAAMACAVVWRLERATAPEAITFCAFLVRLSGRQMKHGKTHTAPALLAGLYVYLAMLDALEQHSVEDLRGLMTHLRFTQPDTG